MLERNPTVEIKEALVPFKSSEPIQGRLLLYPHLGRNSFQTGPKVEDQQKIDAAEKPSIDKRLYQDLTELSDAERKERWEKEKADWQVSQASKKVIEQAAGRTYTEKQFNAKEMWYENFKKNAEKGTNLAFLRDVSAALRAQPADAHYQCSDTEVQFLYSTFIYDKATKTKFTVEAFVNRMDNIFGATYATLPDETKNSMLWLARQLFGGDVSGEMIMQISDLNIKQKHSSVAEQKTRAQALIDQSQSPTDNDKVKLAKVRYYLKIPDHDEPQPLKVKQVRKAPPTTATKPAPLPTASATTPVTTAAATKPLMTAKATDAETKANIPTPQEIAAEIMKPVDPTQDVKVQLDSKLDAVAKIYDGLLSGDPKTVNESSEAAVALLKTKVISKTDDTIIQIPPNDEDARQSDTSVQALQLLQKVFLFSPPEEKTAFLNFMRANETLLKEVLNLFVEDTSDLNSMGYQDYSAKKVHSGMLQTILDMFNSAAETNPAEVADIIIYSPEINRFFLEQYKSYDTIPPTWEVDEEQLAREDAKMNIQTYLRLLNTLAENGQRTLVFQAVRANPQLVNTVKVLASPQEVETLVDISKTVERLPDEILGLAKKIGVDQVGEKELSDTVWRLAEEEETAIPDLLLITSNYQTIINARIVTNGMMASNADLAAQLEQIREVFFGSDTSGEVRQLAARLHAVLKLKDPIDLTKPLSPQEIDHAKKLLPLLRLLPS